MNAIQFIQKHGVKRAKECLPSYEKYYCGLEQLFVEELKRLVESVDYVLIHGYEKSKEILKNAPLGAECYSWSLGNSGVRDKTVELVKLKQAIADYESIYGGENV